MEAGKAEAQRSRIPMGLTGKMPRGKGLFWHHSFVCT